MANSEPWPIQIQGKLMKWNKKTADWEVVWVKREKLLLDRTYLNPFPDPMDDSHLKGDAGHLIGRQFQGTVQSSNIIPQNNVIHQLYHNTKVSWTAYENDVAAYVKHQFEVHPDLKFKWMVKPIYGKRDGTDATEPLYYTKPSKAKAMDRRQTQANANANIEKELAQFTSQ